MYKLISRKKIYREYLEQYLQETVIPNGIVKTKYLTVDFCREVENKRKAGFIRDQKELFESEIIRLVQGNKLGILILESDDFVYVLIPPFPINSLTEFSESELSQLFELVYKPRLIMMVLIRLGRFVVAVINDAEVIYSKSGTRFVKNKHKAGGSSQRRFERNRERMVREFYDQVCTHTRNLFEENKRNVEWLLFGGEKDTIKNFQERCKFLATENISVLDRIIEINRPGVKAMGSAIKELHCCVVYELKKTF